jgi:glucosamine-6-phosphate deaminase
MPTLARPCVTARRVYGAKLPCYVFDSNTALAQSVAAQVAEVIRERNGEGKPSVLGLPTGSTPVGVYRELTRLHRHEGLDFSNVITFNLDEYYGLRPDSLQSYHRWMHEQFFQHVNVRPEHIHIPDGTVPLEDVENYCRGYERQIAEAGGIDLMLLGIGGNGHIGFNEPFSTCSGRTRLCTLDPVTRKAAASDFFSEDAVPLQAITMGLATIMSARKILLLALGEHKAEIIREAAEGPVTERVPASVLQNHPDAAFLMDEAAASELTGVATPWLIGGFQMTDAAIKRAVLWLCAQTGKALLKLNDDDFRRHNLHQLLRHHGPAQTIAQRVFRWMTETINDHPAGEAETSGRKRIICFSPHPDDDVISMGGTLIRLNEDGHEVHIAYMTSGNIAVFDHDARRVADMVTEYNRMFGIEDPRVQEVERSVDEALRSKQPGTPDVPAVLKIKGLIRWSEAKAGALYVGCKEERLHFLDLPFYKTGTIAKKPVGEEDIDILCEMIRRIRPDQIYMAGDLSDPHGTHRVCADAILQSLRRLEDNGTPIPEVLLYRGAWQEYPLHEIEIAVPLSPRDLDTKRMAIFMHESQKDTALFPGSDPREFWQRAEDRNKHTAASYNQIGLPEYFAMEAFVRWNGVPI